MRLLRAFGEFCTAHEIPFTLCFGSLLGAVRHQGFIPWDDDIDLALPRAAYQRLMSLRGVLEETTGLVLRAGEGIRDPYPYPYAKFMDRDTVLIEDSATAVPLGVNIDVFPLDGQPGAPLLRALQLRSLRVMALAMALQGHTGRSARNIPPVLWRILKFMISRVRPGLLARLQTRIASLVSSDRADLVGVVVWGPQASVPREWWEPGANVAFEGLSMPAPAHADGILRATYGDYMRLPPLEEQVTHHQFVAFHRRSADGLP